MDRSKYFKIGIHYFLVIGVLMTTRSAHSQNRPVLDSLWSEYHSAVYDTVRVDILNELATQYFLFDVDSCAYIVQQSIQMSKKIGYEKGTYDANNRRVDILTNNGEYREALEIINRNIQRGSAMRDDLILGQSLNRLGLVYIYMQDYDRAVEPVNKSYELFKVLGDTSRMASTLFTLAELCVNIGKYDEALDHCQKSIEIAQEFGNRLYEGTYLNGMAYILMNKGDYDLAIETFEKSLRISEEMGNLGVSSYTLNNIGMVLSKKGEYERAINYFNKSIEIKQKLNDIRGLIFSWDQLASTYQKTGKYSDALELLLKSLATKRKMNHEQGIGVTYLSIGEMYQAMGLNNQSFYNEAEYYFDEALKWSKKYNIKRIEAQALRNLGNIHKILGDEDAALRYYSNSLRGLEKLNEPLEKALTTRDLADLYYSIRQYPKANTYFHECLTHFTELGANSELALCYLGLGRSYLALYDYSDAEKYALLAYESNVIVEKENAAGLLAEIAYSSENFESAYRYSNDKYLLRDSIINMEQRIRIDSMLREMMSIRELDVHRKDNQLKSQKLKVRNYQLAVIGGFAILLLGGLLTFRSNSIKSQKFAKQMEQRNMALQESETNLIEANKRNELQNVETLKKNEQLESLVEIINESNRNLERLVYVAAHDLKTPLRTISSMTQLLSEKYKDKLSDDDIELQKLVINGCQYLTSFVERLLQFHKMASDPITLTEVNTDLLVKNCIQLVLVCKEKREMIKVPQKLPFVLGAQELLHTLFMNLFDNAIKFTQSIDSPEISITFDQNHKDFITFHIADNGIGIPKAHQEEIFQLFKKLNTIESFGSCGMGLTICKKIIEKHDGQIWIESENGQGTSIYFTLKPLTGENSESYC